MTIGDGIFGAALVFAAVALIMAFKDRWNWKKPLLAVLVFGTIMGLGVWGWTVYQRRPRAPARFWNIALGDTISDVRFRKGIPLALRDGVSDSDKTYVYRENERTEVWVRFWDQKVQGVTILSNDELREGVEGIPFGSGTAALVDRFGVPSEAHESSDGLTRIYTFPRYRLFFALALDRIDAMGLYNAAQGLPIAFNEEAPTPPETGK